MVGQGSKPELTPYLQELLQPEWEALSAEQQCSRRSERAKFGYACCSCGRVGYFRRNCPSCPPVRFCGVAKAHVPLGQEKKAASTAKSSGYTTTASSSQKVKGTVKDAGIGSGIYWGTAADVLRRLQGDASLCSEAISDLRRGMLLPRDDDSNEVASLTSFLTAPEISVTGEPFKPADCSSSNAECRPLEVLQRETDSLADAYDHEPHSCASASEAMSLGERDQHTWHWNSSSNSHRSNSSKRVHSQSYLRVRNPSVVQRVEASWFLALQRLGEALAEQLEGIVGPAANQLLQAPRPAAGGRLGDANTYYPPELVQQHGEYYTAEATAAGTLAEVKNHQYYGALRLEDKLSYVFDRSYHRTSQGLKENLSKDYHSFPKGYRGTNIHAAIGWRPLTTSLDRYASHGRSVALSLERATKGAHTQGKWVRQQQVALVNRRSVCTHLAAYLRKLIEEDQRRESELLGMKSGREQRTAAAASLRARAESADHIMDTLDKYGLLSGIEMAAYLKSGIIVAGGGSLHVNNVDEMSSVGQGGDSYVHKSSSQDTAISKLSKNSSKISSSLSTAESADTESPYLQHFQHRLSTSSHKQARPRSHSSYKPRRTENSSTCSHKHSVKRSQSDLALEAAFRRAGASIRKGTAQDSTALPALIPLPAALFSHDLKDKNSSGEERSYAAERIMERVKAAQRDPVTGVSGTPLVPLWQRATLSRSTTRGTTRGTIRGSSGGEFNNQSYSALIGHTLSVLTRAEGVLGSVR